MSERMDINRVLVQMRAMKAQMQPQATAALRDTQDSTINSLAHNQEGSSRFGDVMTQAVNKVNQVQQSSAKTSNAYLNGDKSVDVVDVMVASQKASVAFDSAVQVRNKLVEAYRDVMNMPI
ncbi:MAG: flagellar hook-basal body complex protein FliE [Cellvibrionaceae bacterium]|nr:flagellar hook-basal body complex protein FliE [Cellvibrionaceae bacterium]